MSDLWGFTKEAFLGDDAGKALHHIARRLQYLRESGAPEKDANSLKAREAAVHAARLAIPKLAALAKAPPAVMEALAIICDGLERVERDLRQIAPEKRTGPRGASQRQLQFRARAVFAIDWLRRLKWEPMQRDEAIAAVAAIIPESMLTYRRRRYTGEERLAAWLDAFAEHRKTRRTKAVEQALEAVRYEVWEEWFRTWRDPVRDANGNPVLDDKGEWVYGEEQERDDTAAMRTDVLQWLANSFHGRGANCISPCHYQRHAT